MIDWVATKKQFGFTSADNLQGLKRPKVVCLCDGCRKPKIIAMRVKSEIINNQWPWQCPSCISLARSSTISEQMTKQWRTKTYRTFQKSHRDDNYKTKMRASIKRKWQDRQYRSKLAVGINRIEFIERAKKLYGERFDYTNTTIGTWFDPITIICNTCHSTLRKLPQKHLEFGFCDHCGGSKGQRQLTDFVKTIAQCICDDHQAIPPHELDIFIPSHQLAIEYHGLYWHSHGSEIGEERDRHQMKALLCAKEGIRLFQFFDYEWQEKNEIVKSMIRHALGQSTRLKARNLSITPLTNQEAKNFFNINHLYGHRTASWTIALRSATEIIMAASFSKYLDGIEIMRMATKLHHNVAGGVSRLIKAAKDKFKCPIYTFADLRFSTAKGYEKAGFKQLKLTAPNYFYIKNGERLSRQRCQKHKLAKLLPKFDQNLSESQNMFANRYRRVWDAGHIKLKLV